MIENLIPGMTYTFVLLGGYIVTAEVMEKDSTKVKIKLSIAIGPFPIGAIGTLNETHIMAIS